VTVLVKAKVKPVPGITGGTGSLDGDTLTLTTDTFDPDKTTPLKAGSFMMHPAKAHHFDGAKNEEVIVQIIGMGPSNTTLVDPKQGHTGRSKK